MICGIVLSVCLFRTSTPDEADLTEATMSGNLTDMKTNYCKYLEYPVTWGVRCVT